MEQSGAVSAGAAAFRKTTAAAAGAAAIDVVYWFAGASKRLGDVVIGGAWTSDIYFIGGRERLQRGCC